MGSYSTLREIKVSTIRKIIKDSKEELLKIQKNHPSKVISIIFIFTKY